MKRLELIRHITRYGAFLAREGRRHSIYQRGKHKTGIPRHTEITDDLAKKITGSSMFPSPDVWQGRDGRWSLEQP